MLCVEYDVPLSDAYMSDVDECRDIVADVIFLDVSRSGFNFPSWLLFPTPLHAEGPSSCAPPRRGSFVL